MSEAFVHLMCFYLTYVVTVLCDPRASFFRIRGCKDMRKEESLWNHSVSHPCSSLRFTQVHTHAHTHTRAFTHVHTHVHSRTCKPLHSGIGTKSLGCQSRHYFTWKKCLISTTLKPCQGKKNGSCDFSMPSGKLDCAWALGRVSVVLKRASVALNS